MKKIKITIICTSQDGTELDGAKFWYEVSRKLIEKKVIVKFVCYTKEAYLFLKEKKSDACYYPDIIKNFKVKDFEKEVILIEKKYDCSIEQILVSDYQYSHSVSRKKALLDMIKIFYFWEKLIEKEKSDFIFGSGQRFVHMVAYNICRKNKTKYLVLFSSLIPNTFGITENIRGRLTLLDKYWNKNKNNALTKQEEENTNNYIKSFKEKRTIINVRDSSPKLNLEKIKYALNRIYCSLFVERGKTPYLKPLRGIKEYILKILRSKISNIYFSKPKKGEKYLFFPLHVEWDSPILVWNPQFLHQERLVDIISKSLPFGYKLYVKTHPNDIGGNLLSQLKKISSLPNVRLLYPTIDSHQLVRNASVNIVISGTVGWESIIFQKMPIVFGETYYNKSGLLFQINDLSKTNEIIKEALRQNFFNDIKLKKFANAHLKTVYPGQIGFSALYYSNTSNRQEILNETNIRLVVKSFLKAINLDFK